VVLRGAGLPALRPAIALSPRAHDFGGVLAGTSSRPLTVTIANKGDGDLAVDLVDIEGEAFAIDPAGGTDPFKALPAVIPPGKARTLEAVFHPPAPGEYSNAFRVVSNDPANPDIAVSLTGRGLDVCGLSPVGSDCNGNGVVDPCDIARGTSADVDGDGVPDECGGGGQVRGDGNQDGKLDISDAPWPLGYLFQGTFTKLPCDGGTAGSPAPGARTLLDATGDSRLDLSDAVAVLSYLFLGTSPPGLKKGCLPIAGCPQVCAP
jgi:hypothetical protein